MHRRGLALGLVVLVGFVALFSQSRAAFSETYRSTQAVLGTGSVKLSLSTPEILSTERWKPGDSQLVRSTITNTGSLPVILDGKISGAWEDTTLDASIVSMPTITLYREPDTAEVIASKLSVEEWFEFGVEPESQYALKPGETWEVQVEYQLADVAESAYQQQNYLTTIELIATQH